MDPWRRTPQALQVPAPSPTTAALAGAWPRVAGLPAGHVRQQPWAAQLGAMEFVAEPLSVLVVG